jgi:hypothetical protein
MRHTWTTRVVFAMGTLLLAGSVVAAAARSSTGPAAPKVSVSANQAAATAAAPAREQVAARPQATASASAAASPRPSPSAKAATAKPAAAVAPPPLLSDDFEKDALGANPPAGWAVADGAWNGVVMDATHVLQHGATLGRITSGSPVWTDYIVSADVKVSAGPGFAAVAGRYQGLGSYYQCDLHGGNALQLWKLQGGMQTMLASSPATIDPAKFHTVKLAMKGPAIACVLDGAVNATAADTTFTSGGIALAAGAGEQAEFDNVTVTTV